MILTAAALIVIGALASWWDLRRRIIPDTLLLLGGAFFFALSVATGRVLPDLLGLVLVATIALAAACIGGGLGGGDVKYLMLTGLALGPVGGLWAALLSGSLGVVAHIGLRLAGRDREGVPLAPAIAIASVVAALAFLPH